jgi:hypothetical protein
MSRFGKELIEAVGQALAHTQRRLLPQELLNPGTGEGREGRAAGVLCPGLWRVASRP